MGCCLSAPDDDAAPGAGVSGTHEFTIRRYSQTKGTGAGKSLLSRYFTVDKRKWFVRFYPDGYTANSHFVAFYVQTLYRPPPFRAVRATFTFELLRPDGAVAYARRSDRPCSFDRRCNCWGFRVFVTREALEGAGLGVLYEDSIRARCTVEVVNSRRKPRPVPVPAVPLAPAATVRPSAPVMEPHSDFARNAMRFFVSGRAPYDVMFSVAGATFEAHRLVVAAQSEWFAAVLYGRGQESSWKEAALPCVEIGGTSPEAFEGVLHYIYHDELPEELIRAKGEAAMTRELFEAADMFLMERMKKLCASRMCRFIKDDTVHGIMDLAKAHSCKELEQACHNYLRRRASRS